eukprot:421272-Amphidinium_carterae.2
MNITYKTNRYAKTVIVEIVKTLCFAEMIVDHWQEQVVRETKEREEQRVAELMREVLLNVQDVELQFDGEITH